MVLAHQQALQRLFAHVPVVFLVTDANLFKHHAHQTHAEIMLFVMRELMEPFFAFAYVKIIYLILILISNFILFVI